MGECCNLAVVQQTNERVVLVLYVCICVVCMVSQSLYVQVFLEQYQLPHQWFYFTHVLYMVRHPAVCLLGTLHWCFSRPFVCWMCAFVCVSLYGLLRTDMECT